MSNRSTDEATRVGGALVGPYRTVRPLGFGGMANVLEAVDTRSGAVVALKVLRAETAAHSEAVARFTREARALHNLKHPNIVEVFDHGVSDEGDAWIAMELLQGSSLKELVRADGSLEPARAVRLVVDVAKALATVHARGLVHRDIKPENVFVVAANLPEETAKLIDFGIARVTQAELGEYSVQYTRVGKMLGSAAFMAPEQASGKADHRADVFSLGVTLYEVLTGSLPFEGRSPQALMEARARGAIVPLKKRLRGATLPPELENLIRRMLAPDPADRPDGGLALLKELNTVLHLLGGAARGSTPSLAAPAAPPSSSRHPRLSIPVREHTATQGVADASGPANTAKRSELPPSSSLVVALRVLLGVLVAAILLLLAFLTLRSR